MTQVPQLIHTPELQMWQESGSEHKSAAVLAKAGSAGPQDLAVLLELELMQACTQILVLAPAATSLFSG